VPEEQSWKALSGMGRSSHHRSILSEFVLKGAGRFAVCLRFGGHCSAFAVLGHHHRACLSRLQTPPWWW